MPIQNQNTIISTEQKQTRESASTVGPTAQAKDMTYELQPRTKKSPLPSAEANGFGQRTSRKVQENQRRDRSTGKDSYKNKERENVMISPPLVLRENIQEQPQKTTMEESTGKIWSDRRDYNTFDRLTTAIEYDQRASLRGCNTFYIT